MRRATNKWLALPAADRLPGGDDRNRMRGTAAPGVYL